MDKGHSEDYFGDERDFWWNQDFFDLLAQRWDLPKYSSLLDVGCGLCHWSKLFCPYLKQPAEIFALDNDPKWAKGNDAVREYFNNRNAIVRFIQGDANQLPFPDNFFDVVTCQTVLIHLKEPFKALQEMKRVLKNEGVLICAEMNNSAGALVRSSITEDEPIQDTLDRLKFHLICERGKKNLGEGDNSIGDLLPGYFARLDLKNIRVFLSDKASPMLPPYETAEEKAMLQTLDQWLQNNAGDFDFHQALRYFKGFSDAKENLAFFDKQWQKIKEDALRQKEAIAQKNYSSGGAYVMYLVSGNKGDK